MGRAPTFCPQDLVSSTARWRNAPSGPSVSGGPQPPLTLSRGDLGKIRMSLPPGLFVRVGTLQLGESSS